MRDPVLEVRNVTHRYGERAALIELNLDIYPGQTVGLFGANGAGKTTTMRILAGLLKPTAGTVSVLGGPVHKSLRHIGVVMEEPTFYPGMTARENLDFAVTCTGRELGRRQQHELLERVGLGKESGKIKGYSLGMRRRLALAIAIAKNPRLLLLDEPTNGLDLGGLEMLQEVLREQIAAGAACLFSTHEWDQAEQLVDRAVILDQGKVLVNEVLTDLTTPRNRWRIQSASTIFLDTLRSIPELSIISADENGVCVVALQGVPIEVVTNRLVESGCALQLVERYHRPLADVYRRIVKEGPQ